MQRNRNLSLSIIIFETRALRYYCNTKISGVLHRSELFLDTCICILTISQLFIHVRSFHYNFSCRRLQSNHIFIQRENCRTAFERRPVIGRIEMAFMTSPKRRVVKSPICVKYIFIDASINYAFNAYIFIDVSIFFIDTSIKFRYLTQICGLTHKLAIVT